MLDALKGKLNDYGKLSHVEWSNPDAHDGEGHYPPPATTQSSIEEALATINLGNWLAKNIAYKLAALGGRFDLQPPVQHKKKKSKSKKVGKRKRGVPARSSRNSKRISRSGKTAMRLRHKSHTKTKS
jgi:hypothetical protein